MTDFPSDYPGRLEHGARRLRGQGLELVRTEARDWGPTAVAIYHVEMPRRATPSDPLVPRVPDAT